MKKMFSPEPAEMVAAAPAAPKKNGRTYDADADFIAVAGKVSATWTATPALTLLWTNAATLAQQVADWKNYYQGSSTGKGSKSAKANALKQLDKEINTAIAQVKLYLQEKFGKKNAPAEYYRYAMVKRDGGYEWAADRDSRVLNFPQLIAAIAADGFGSKTYGTAFWTAMQTSYTDALEAAKDNTSDTTENTGNKNELKKTIMKTLVSLRKLVEANYPDTYPNVVRQWGWQKETY